MAASSMVRSGGPEDIFLKAIYDVLKIYAIDDEAQRRFEELASDGFDVLRSDATSAARSLEAIDNFTILAKTIRLGLTRGKREVGVKEIEFALSSLCPIFPIC